MNSYTRLCWSVFLLALLASCDKRKESAPSDTFSSISRSFKQPGHQYGSAPLWVWNADVDTATIHANLRDFKDKGFGGVFIHPRAGLITPYASQQWFDLCAYTLQEAKKLDLDVWIYDENSYPSGFAGGRVPDVMPESYNQGQMLQLEKVNALPRDASAWFMALRNDGDHFSDVTKEWPTSQGDYYLLKKTFYAKSDWYGGFTYVDLMVKGVTEKFIEQTMPGYEKVFGAEFGKSVPGIFTDEPNIEIQGERSIRWTPDLFSSFQKTWGYPLETSLPSLFEETGDWKKVRHNYYQVLMQLFIDRWSKPYYEYTKNKNLEWTGHYWEHEWPNPHVVPDNMAMYAWHQRPAVDMLFNQFDEVSPHAQFGNIRAIKELSSVANQLDKKRTLSETYGGAGWEISYRDMKRLGDWEFVLGVNTLNQHLAHMTLMGARKYDYPQSFSYHNPWWPYYKSLNDYFTRLAFMLSTGRQQNNILIIEPTTTAWMYYNRDKPNARFTEIGDQFQQFVTLLEKSQVEYDLGSENIIRDHGGVKGDKFVVGSREYGVVVLPPGIENLNLSTFDLLEKYGAAGGHILQFNPLSAIDGHEDKRIAEFYSKSMDHLEKLPPINEVQDGLLSNDASKQFQIIRNKPIQGDLYHHRRIVSDGEILFISNASLSEPVKGSIQAAGVEVFAMDLFNGETETYPSERAEQLVRFDFDLPPAGSQMFFIPAALGAAGQGSAGLKTALTGRNSAAGVLVNLPEVSEIRRTEENVLAIDFVDIGFGKTKLKDLNVYDATDTLFKHYGFRNGNPWNTSVQYKSNTIARDTFKTGTGFTATYHFNVSARTNFSALKAVVERAGLYRVSVNGSLVEPLADQWWLDKVFNVFEIGKYVHTGQNELSLVSDKMSIHAEIEPVYILGDFSLSSAAKGWTIAPPVALKLGSWKSQGLPMYSQTVSYEKKFSLQKQAGKQYLLQLGQWEGTVCSVTVNGEAAGVIAYPPYQLDITSTLKSGDNSVSVAVVGSLKNLLGPFHNKPAPGLVSPWHYRGVKSYPPGKDYDLYDYGLITDYTLLER